VGEREGGKRGEGLIHSAKRKRLPFFFLWRLLLICKRDEMRAYDFIRRAST
jgi:hypothetical protein